MTKQAQKWTKVGDHLGRRIRGLWQRGSSYYCQVRVDGKTSRIKLHNALTVPQARAAMQELLKQRRDGTLTVQKSHGTPVLAAAIDDYLAELSTTGRRKAATVSRQRGSLKSWKAFAGSLKITAVSDRTGEEFARHRRNTDGVSGRAVDNDIIALRHVLRWAKARGFIKAVPLEKWSRLAGPPKRIRLLDSAELDRLVEAAIAHIQNHRHEQEALHLAWGAVDWARGQIEIGRGADGRMVAKGRLGMERSRFVPFNARLEALLKSMAIQWDGQSPLLFPSSRGGGVVTSYKKSLGLVKRMAAVPDFGFHHLRHWFISQAVMTGIDYRTIAEWVGHQDGGVLIGRTYAHLRPGHSAEQAARLRL
jgi:integrase